MTVSSHYVLEQGPMLATLGKTAMRALAQRFGTASQAAPALPSPEITRRFEAPPDALLDAYVKHIGGEARAHRAHIPPSFFPHWVMPVAADTLQGLPYPITRVLNGGCRMQSNAPLPRGEALFVRAQLTHIDDDGKRAVLTQHVITGTAAQPDALVTDLYAVVPLGSGKEPRAKPKERPHVPLEAKEIGSTRLQKNAGLSFAKLTGDFNPIHWLSPAAHAAGFPDVILQGFSTFARTSEALCRGVFGGDVNALTTLDVKFVKPLRLPHEIRFFVLGNAVFVADALGGPAYLTGHFNTKNPEKTS